MQSPGMTRWWLWIRTAVQIGRHGHSEDRSWSQTYQKLLVDWVCTTREIEESSKPLSYFYEHFVDVGELGMIGLRTDLWKPRNLRRFEKLACAWRFTFINARNHYSNKILTKIVPSQVLDHITWRSPKFSTMTGWARSFFAVWGCPVHCIMFSSILGLCSHDSSSVLQIMTSKKSL